MHRHPDQCEWRFDRLEVWSHDARMAEGARRLRGWQSTLLLAAALLLLPGCATCLVWGVDWPTLEEGDEAFRDSLHRIGEETHEQDVAIVTTARADHVEVRLEGAPDAPSWRLRPGPGAEAFAALLARPELFTPAHAAITARRRVNDGDVVKATAELTLLGAFRREAIGAPVDAASLGAGALAVLAEPRCNHFAFAADPWLHLPRVLRACMQRVANGNLGALIDGAQHARIASFVFVGADGSPRFEPSAPAAEGADRADLPMAERLAILREVDLLLRLEGEGAPGFLRLRADLWWLWSACGHGADGARHVSEWQLEAAAPVRAASTAALSAHVVRVDEIYRTQVLPPSSRTWLKVAATPLALAVDATVLLVPNLLLAWAHSDDDDDEPLRTPPHR